MTRLWSGLIMSKTELSIEETEQLITLLERRLEIIGDADLRENDPDRQLKQLQEVSEAIMAFHQENREHIPVRLNHFLENCSFEKALHWAKETRQS